MTLIDVVLGLEPVQPAPQVDDVGAHPLDHVLPGQVHESLFVLRRFDELPVDEILFAIHKEHVGGAAAALHDTFGDAG